MSMVALNGAFDPDQTHDTDILHSMAESEFKHAPSVSFDEIDYRNEVDLKKAQESMLKEQFVKIEVVKIVRKALENCFKVNGPNGYEDCREIADKYMALLPESRAQGYLGYQRNDPTK